MFYKPILLILFISIVSAEGLKIEKNEELKDLPDKNEVLEALIKSINIIRGNLEIALKTLTGTDLLNTLQDPLLRLATSMHLAIGYQHSLRDQLGDVIEQTNDASAQLKYILENSGSVNDFVENIVVPLILSLKNLVPTLNHLMDANGIDGYNGEAHGNHGHGDPSALHGKHHGGEHNHKGHRSSVRKEEGHGNHGGPLNNPNGNHGDHKPSVRKEEGHGQHPHEGAHNHGGHDKNHPNHVPTKKPKVF
jgi:hypothetical protein